MLPPQLTLIYWRLLQNEDATPDQERLKRELAKLSGLLDEVAAENRTTAKVYELFPEPPMISGQAPMSCFCCGRVFR